MEFASSGFLTDFTGVQGAIAQSTIYGRTGTHSIESTVSDADYIYQQFSAISEVYNGFAWYPLALPTDGNALGIWRLYKGATSLAYLKFNSSNTLELYIGGVLTATASAAITTANAHHHLEIRYKLAGAGVVQVWQDQTLVIDYSGNTQPDANLTFDEVRICPTPDGAAKGYLSDFLIWTSGRAYDAKVRPLSPNAAGDINEWAGAYTDLDDKVADGDSTKLRSDTAAQTALFHIEDMASDDVSSIAFVQLSGRAKQGGLPPDAIKLALKAGGTQSDATAASLTTDYSTRHAVWVNNPATSSGWTKSQIGALQIGAVSA